MHATKQGTINSTKSHSREACLRRVWSPNACAKASYLHSFMVFWLQLHALDSRRVVILPASATRCPHRCSLQPRQGSSFPFRASFTVSAIFAKMSSARLEELMTGNHDFKICVAKSHISQLEDNTCSTEMPCWWNFPSPRLAPTPPAFALEQI